MTDVSVLSGSEAIKFLQWLDPKGLHNLVAIDPVTKAVEAQTFDFSADFAKLEAEAWVRGRNTTANLYFSINRPRPDARRDSKLRRDEIGAVRAFHVDIDNLDGAPDWDMDCMPSAVVDSGNGQWGFWKLDAPLVAEDVAAVEAQNRALTGRFHGDTQAHNLDRIARLPGTLNIPNEAKRKKGRVEALARVLSLNAITYAPAEVAAWCAPLAVSQSGVDHTQNGKDLGVELDTQANTAKAIKWLLNAAPEAELGNGSNGTTYKVAARLKDFGVSQGAALDLMLDFWNDAKSNPPWPAAKLQDLLKHAWRYGTGAAGKDSPALAEVEFDAVEIEEKPRPKKRQMQPLWAGDIAIDFKVVSPYLIHGWYDRSTFVVTYGESNSGKTHVVLDQALAIATGRTWAGRKTHKGLVVYVAAEGGSGVERRVMAHRLKRPEVDWDSAAFVLVKFPIDLMHNEADAKALVTLVREAEERAGQKCAMVVVDTLSRALAGGDENSSSDMGAFVKRCDQVRDATGACLHVIHHAGKNTAKGARGHSLLRAAVDTEIEIENGSILSRKQRDAEPPGDLRFNVKGVVLGEDAEGNTVTAAVPDIWESTEFEVELTPLQESVWRAAVAIAERETQETQNGSETICDKRSVILTPEKVGTMTLQNVSESTIDRAFRHLVEIGVFAKGKRGQYYLNRSVIPSSKRQTE